MKIRLDKALVERGLAASRERAQALVLAGRVLVAEQRVEKPGTPIDEGAALRLLGDDLRYVGRGGLKLERALEHWRIALDGRACIDVGASTGGFTDCMLQHGAASVLAVDTGYGQIAHKLRVDPRVTLRERCNARLLGAGELVGADARGDFIPCDGCVVHLGDAGVARGAAARWRLRARHGKARRSSSSSRSSRRAGSTWARVGSCASRRGARSPSSG